MRERKVRGRGGGERKDQRDCWRKEVLFSTVLLQLASYTTKCLVFTCARGTIFHWEAQAKYTHTQ